mmetsp:Transcript_59317/g.104339  ORF Transcript_59317/g.104339 Transcript_59317/m.104339 type:complete len:299 (-) Transcript_59317:165-1061(-)
MLSVSFLLSWPRAVLFLNSSRAALTPPAAGEFADDLESSLSRWQKKDQPPALAVKMVGLKSCPAPTRACSDRKSRLHKGSWGRRTVCTTGSTPGRPVVRSAKCTELSWPVYAKMLPEGDQATAWIQPSALSSRYASPKTNGPWEFWNGPASTCVPSTSVAKVLNTRILKSAQPVASSWPLVGWNAQHSTVLLNFFLTILQTHQSFALSYVHTGTHFAPDVTANRKPSADQRTSVAARSIRRITRAGFQEFVSGWKVHTNAFRSCEQETILLVTPDQSIALTIRSCSDNKNKRVQFVVS